MSLSLLSILKVTSSNISKILVRTFTQSETNALAFSDSDPLKSLSQFIVWSATILTRRLNAL